MKPIIFILLLLPLISTANIYQKTNPDGSVTFTDEAIEGSKPVIIDDQSMGRVTVERETKVSPLKQLRSQFLNEDDSGKADQKSNLAKNQYSQLSISAPSNEQTFWNQSSIPVLVNIDPELKEPDQIQLYLDDTAYGSPQANTKFSLNNVSRGQHSIKVVIVNQSGQTLKESSTVVFFVHRTNIIDANT